jgi:hypothetical protein
VLEEALWLYRVGLPHHPDAPQRIEACPIQGSYVVGIVSPRMPVLEANAMRGIVEMLMIHPDFRCLNDATILMRELEKARQRNRVVLVSSGLAPLLWVQPGVC